MDHRFQQRNATDRSRYGGGFARRAIGRAHPEGNVGFTNQINSSEIASESISWNGTPVEGCMHVSESWRNSSKGASGRPIKTLIQEEMSREKKASQSSPSVIAKLMGLDSVPPPQMAAKQQKETRRGLLETPFTPHKDRLLNMTSGERQEFKDVFEIKDPIRIEKHKKQMVFKGSSHLKHEDTDVAFIREKFLEAKRLSTDGNFQNSKEFNDAIEVLDSNKDLLLKFLEEPNSLFTKHLHDSEGFSPAPHESNITVLRSSKGKISRIVELPAKFEIKSERCAQMQKYVSSSLPKPTTNLFNHLLKEHRGSLSQKLKSRYAGKSSGSHQSTRIVVLKPNLEKVQGMSSNVPQPRSSENFPFGCSRHREIQDSEFMELHAEGRERQNLFDNVQVMGQRTKGSREIAREITRQMKHSARSDSDKMLGSGFRKYSEDENSCGPSPSCMYNSHNSDRYQRTLDTFDCRNDTLSSSTSCSSESPVSREARKRLCERWRMTNRIQEASPVCRSMSTLGEMFAQSDGVPRGIVDSGAVQKISDDKPVRGMLGKQLYSSGTGSRNRRKDECSTNLLRSSSLPASSTAHGTSKPSRRRVSDGDNCYMLKDVLNLGVDDPSSQNSNQRQSPSRKSFKFRNYTSNRNPSGEENKLPVREIRVNQEELKIHVNQEELRNGVHVSDHSELKPVLSQLGDSSVVNSGNLVNNPSVMGCMNGEMPSLTSEAHLQQSVLKAESSGINHIDEAIEEASSGHPQVDSVPFQCDGTGSQSLAGSKEAEQPSPVSVLDHPSEEGESSPECFERVSADLQGLRMQLQLLRLESDQYNTGCETSASSEDGMGECDSSSLEEGTLHMFRDDEDRDYLYVYGMLTNLGVHGVSKDRLLSACCSLKRSVDVDVFDKLEEKYGALVGWSNSERKMLFDLVRTILADTLSTSVDQNPWLKPWRKFCLLGGCEGLVEEVCQMVVRTRKEVNQEEKILDPRWLDLGDDVDTMGRDIEEMLEDELLEELVSELISN